MKTQLTRWHPSRELEPAQTRPASRWDFDPFRGAGNGDTRETLTGSEWTPRVDIVEGAQGASKAVEIKVA